MPGSVTDTCATGEIPGIPRNLFILNRVRFDLRGANVALTQRMAFLSELRYPTTRLAKVISALLALALFLFVAVCCMSGYVIYQALRPQRSTSSVNLDLMMGHPTSVSFHLADGTERDGWFFPGLRGAPTVVVCHGYLSQRSDVLTLVTALQDHQFNVFLFDFLGHGTSPRGTTLGYKESGELRSAIQMLSSRDDVDPQHFGLWGIDMGGYAVLEVATSNPRIAAIALDNAYPDPRVMMQIQLRRSGLSVIPFVDKATDLGFRMANYQFRNEPSVMTRISQLKTMPKLFIESGEQAYLANQLLDIYGAAPQPKQLVRDQLTYADMGDDDRKTYENQVVSFFLQSIPPGGTDR